MDITCYGIEVETFTGQGSGHRSVGGRHRHDRAGQQFGVGRLSADGHPEPVRPDRTAGPPGAGRRVGRRWRPRRCCGVAGSTRPTQASTPRTATSSRWNASTPKVRRAVSTSPLSTRRSGPASRSTPASTGSADGAVWADLLAATSTTSGNHGRRHRTGRAGRRPVEPGRRLGWRLAVRRRRRQTPVPESGLAAVAGRRTSRTPRSATSSPATSTNSSLTEAPAGSAPVRPRVDHHDRRGPRRVRPVRRVRFGAAVASAIRPVPACTSSAPGYRAIYCPIDRGRWRSPVTDITTRVLIGRPDMDDTDRRRRRRRPGASTASRPLDLTDLETTLDVEMTQIGNRLLVTRGISTDAPYRRGHVERGDRPRHRHVAVDRRPAHPVTVPSAATSPVTVKCSAGSCSAPRSATRSAPTCGKPACRSMTPCRGRSAATPDSGRQPRPPPPATGRSRHGRRTSNHEEQLMAHVNPRRIRRRTDPHDVG